MLSNVAPSKSRGTDDVYIVTLEQASAHNPAGVEVRVKLELGRNKANDVGEGARLGEDLQSESDFDVVLTRLNSTELSSFPRWSCGL